MRIHTHICIYTYFYKSELYIAEDHKAGAELKEDSQASNCHPDKEEQLQEQKKAVDVGKGDGNSIGNEKKLKNFLFLQKLRNYKQASSGY